MARKSATIKTLVAGITLLLIALIPTGCAKTHYKHYEGPTLPDSELALINTSRIHSIDGHTHRYGTGGKDFAKALTTGLFSEDFGKAYYQITPGEHEVQILLGSKDKVKQTGGLELHNVLHDFHWYKAAIFRIEVEKGHTYKVKRTKTLINQQNFGHKTMAEFRLDFFLVDECCPSRAPVPLEYVEISRIE